MDMQDFVNGCRECNPAEQPERAAELLKAAAELGEAILKKRKADKVDYIDVINQYNSICDGKLPKVTKITDKRKRSIKNCIAQGISVDELLQAFASAAVSPFLTGQNDRFWVANFDFIIKPDNIVKILEGVYGKPPVKSDKPAEREHSYDLNAYLVFAQKNIPKIE